MSTRYERGGLLTSMYQLLQPPWMSMSRTIGFGVLVVSLAADVEQAEDRAWRRAIPGPGRPRPAGWPGGSVPSSRAASRGRGP